MLVMLSVDADELNKRKVNRQKRMKLEMRHSSRIRRQENRQMGFGEYCGIASDEDTDIMNAATLMIYVSMLVVCLHFTTYNGVFCP